jgi:hypothetical protein
MHGASLMQEAQLVNTQKAQNVKTALHSAAATVTSLAHLAMCRNLPCASMNE